MIGWASSLVGLDQFRPLKWFRQGYFIPLLVSCDLVTQTCTVSSQEICLIISLTGSSCSGVKENIFLVTYLKAVKVLACGEGLRGALASGQDMESLQLRLWNLNICIEKVDAKC